MKEGDSLKQWALDLCNSLPKMLRMQKVKVFSGVNWKIKARPVQVLG